MVKLREKSPRRPRQTKADSRQALNGDLSRLVAELRQSNERYVRMIQSSPDAITLRTLPERRYLEVNEGFCRMTGYTAEEVIGKTSAELNVWADPDQRGATLQRVLREGEVHEEEFRFRTKSGEIRFGQLAAVRVAVGNQQCMLSVSRDITEKRRAEEELRRSEGNFRSLVHDAPFGILQVTLEGCILQANPALVNMLGYESEEEVCKLNIERDVYHDPKQRQRLIEEHSQKKDFHSLEVQWRRKDGKIITTLLNGRRVAASDHAPAYYEVFAEDITQRRILERQLFQSQKMEAIGRLAGGISGSMTRRFPAHRRRSRRRCEACPPRSSKTGNDSSSRPASRPSSQAAARAAATRRRGRARCDRPVAPQVRSSGPPRCRSS